MGSTGIPTLVGLIRAFARPPNSLTIQHRLALSGPLNPPMSVQVALGSIRVAGVPSFGPDGLLHWVPCIACDLFIRPHCILSVDCSAYSEHFLHHDPVDLLDSFEAPWHCLNCYMTVGAIAFRTLRSSTSSVDFSFNLVFLYHPHSSLPFI